MQLDQNKWIAADDIIADMNASYAIGGLFLLSLLFPEEILQVLRDLKPILRDFFAKHCSPEVWEKEKDFWEKPVWP